jgi:predicted metal-dependent enzyme (double-stranded beta helix superfamily)
MGGGEEAAMPFEREQFVADLQGALRDPTRREMREIVLRVVSDPAALFRELGTPREGALQVLHRSAELTVLNVIWSPNQITLPHNHQMNAVIGMYGGREDNMFWRRVPHPEKFQIEAAGGQALGAGDVILLGRDVIHSVVNPLAKLSCAIHVYDGDFLGAHRSMWNSETLAEEPYDVNVAVKGMPWQENG